MDDELSQLLALGNFPPAISRVLHHAKPAVSEQEMTAAFDRLAVRLTALAQDSNPVLLSVLPGASYLCGALMNRMIFPLELAFAAVDPTLPSQDQWVLAGAVPSLSGRLVILCDDGLTPVNGLEALAELLMARGASDLWRCATVAPSADDTNTSGRFSRTLAAVTGDPRNFFGCGLDCQGYCRNLPGLYWR